MADYNFQSIDIDLEEVFDNLSEKDQVEFMTDMFDNLPNEDTQKDVLETRLFLFDDEIIIDIITDAFESISSSNRLETAERIADALTPEQREALIEYIKGE